MKRVMLILSLVGFMFSCSKEPEPVVDFTASLLDNGDVVFNASGSNVSEYKWDFGDGSNVAFGKTVTAQYASNRRYIVTLTAKGDGGQVAVQHEVNVNHIKGSLMFWMKSMRDKEIEVKVDGKYYGKITGYYASGVSPNCGANFCVTVENLSEGNHTFELRELNALFPSEWNNSVKVTARICTKQQIAY